LGIAKIGGVQERGGKNPETGMAIGSSQIASLPFPKLLLAQTVGF